MVARAVLSGLGAGLLVLVVLLIALFALVEPSTPQFLLILSGALVVFLASAAGGATGAWQAAAGGAPSRRTAVAVGGLGTAAVGSVVSAVLAVGTSVPSGRAILEVAAILSGAPAGAWFLARRLRETRP